MKSVPLFDHITASSGHLLSSVNSRGGNFSSREAEMAARAPDGKWSCLFRPERVPAVAGIKTANSDNLIDTSFFTAERRGRNRQER